MPETWDIQKIQSILPQRYPFLFIDRVLEINTAEQKITCIKNVTINDYFFEGHFPGNPVMPGVLIIEAMAQASILLYAALRPEVAEQRPTYYLGKVEVRFSNGVRPGDILILEANIERIISTFGIVKVKATVDKRIVAEASISFSVKCENQPSFNGAK